MMRTFLKWRRYAVLRRLMRVGTAKYAVNLATKCLAMWRYRAAQQRRLRAFAVAKVSNDERSVQLSVLLTWQRRARLQWSARLLFNQVTLVSGLSEPEPLCVAFLGL